MNKQETSRPAVQAHSVTDSGFLAAITSKTLGNCSAGCHWEERGGSSRGGDPAGQVRTVKQSLVLRK